MQPLNLFSEPGLNWVNVPGKLSYPEFNYKDIAVLNAKNISFEHDEKSIDMFIRNPIKIIIFLKWIFSSSRLWMSLPF